ncbi:MAG: cohesin domain-containing protein [Duganella sp.]
MQFRQLKGFKNWRQHLSHLAGVAALLGAFAAPGAVAAPSLQAVASAPLAAGSAVVIDIRIDDVSDLYAYNYAFHFDPTVLRFASAAQGGFLEAGGDTWGDAGVADNSAGVITPVFNLLVGAVAGVSGSGTLARYTFDVIGSGPAAVHFSDVLLLDSGINELAVQYQPQLLAAVPEPSTYLMFGAGLVTLAALRRRRTGAVLPA